MTGYLVASGLGLGWIVATVWRSRAKHRRLRERLRWYSMLGDR